MDRFLLSPAELRARTGGKWRTYPADVLPSFVAEMDFKVAPAVQAAIKDFVDRQDYGYGRLTEPAELYDAFAGWMARRHGWNPDPATTIATADVVQALVATLVAFSEPGGGVVAQTPVYPPFLKSIGWTGRRLIDNPMIDDGSRYVVDLEGLERGASGASVILVCNPQNPTGRVLERAELQGIVEIAAEHGMTIVSDEIHADLVYPGSAHIPMETIPGAAPRTVTLTSATKGFNIPGLQAAVAHFGTPELKARFEGRIPEHLLGGPSRIGVAATIAAWRDGEAWLGEVMAYLDRNRSRVAGWAREHRIAHHTPEATYLAWLDCTGMDIAEVASPQQHFIERARVALGHGADFGEAGKSHVRLNFGTSAEVLEEILGRLSGARL